MHADLHRQFSQRERLEHFVALGQRGKLMLEDRTRRLEQGFVSHAQAAQQPSRLRELLAHTRALGTTLAEHAFVGGVDAKTWAGQWIEFELPIAPFTADDQVRHYV